MPHAKVKPKPKPRALPPPEPEIPKRERRFEYPKRADQHNSNFNYILSERIRITPVGEWHWIERIGQWVGFGERWNRFGKCWSEPQLFHCRGFETEGNTMSKI